MTNVSALPPRNASNAPSRLQTEVILAGSYGHRNHLGPVTTTPVIWAANGLGDRQVVDTFLVNWTTEVETTGPQLWKRERLTIAVLEQLCAV